MADNRFNMSRVHPIPISLAEEQGVASDQANGTVSVIVGYE